jgi:hypothetical protein
LAPFPFCEEQIELSRLRFNESELCKSANDPELLPKVRKEAQRMLSVIESEKNNFEAVKNDINGLIDFLRKPCEACLVKDAAMAQLKKLKEAQTTKQIGQHGRSAPVWNFFYNVKFYVTKVITYLALLFKQIINSIVRVFQSVKQRFF